MLCSKHTVPVPQGTDEWNNPWTNELKRHKFLLCLQFTRQKTFEKNQVTGLNAETIFTLLTVSWGNDFLMK